MEKIIETVTENRPYTPIFQPIEIIKTLKAY